MRPLLPLLCALTLACGGSKSPRKLVLLHTTTFAAFVGVHLKDPDSGAPIANNDPDATISAGTAPR